MLIGWEQCAGRIEPTGPSNNVTTRWCALPCRDIHIFLESWVQMSFRGCTVVCQCVSFVKKRVCRGAGGSMAPVSGLPRTFVGRKLEEINLF